MNERFLSKVEKTDTCWLWKGCIGTDGYGQYTNSKDRSAHRYSYIINKGEIPKGLLIRHTCDVRRCVNPLHLIIGTHQDNMNDMKERRIIPRRRAIIPNNSKLTIDDVKEIKILYGFGFSYRELAKRYNLKDASSIGGIIKGKTWNRI
jgi:hypothetical protein